MTQQNMKPEEGSKRQKRTRSYKHVEIKRERPHLTRNQDDSGADQAPAPKRNFRKSGRKSRPKRPASKLRVIPLGGLDAIGNNMTVFECNGDIVIDDAGLMFPDDDHPGVDLILPDYTYVLENAEKLHGIVITHGHEDHIGALPYLLKDLDCDVKIYATKLTLGLIECKFNEHKISNAKLVEINPGDTVKLGCFTCDFFSVNHSIPGAVGIFFQSPAGNVLHTGDFKLDQTPIDGITTDFAALARFAEIGVDLLMSDSTNATKTAFTPSEATVGQALRSIIANAKGRVIIASFASHIHRLQQICDAAVENKRKVVVTGRSMIQNTDIARKLHYLSISDNNLIDAYELNGIPPEQVVVMCTGSQGEPLSALARIANGEHKTISIESGDTVIISATPVPGNEKAVTRIINLLSKMGCDVYDKSRAQVHVSGHAGSEELKLVLSIVKPKAFMPVHGEAVHLRAHARLAEQTGVPEDSIFIMDNGDTLELTGDSIVRGEVVQHGIVYVDGLSVGDTNQNVLDERSNLGATGFASVAMAIDTKKKEIAGDIQIEMHGITGSDHELLIDEMRSSVRGEINRLLRDGGKRNECIKICRQTLRGILWSRIKQRPMVIVSLIEL